MDPKHSHQRDLVRDELHMELLGWNTFAVAMVGGIAFLVACLAVMVH